MRRLIKADVRRILKKKALWICLLLDGLIRIASLIKYRYDGMLGSFSFTSAVSNMLRFNFLIGIVILLGVYGDELRSQAMTTVIGRGLSRTKVILAKFLDTVILTMIAILITALSWLVMMLIFGIHPAAFEVKWLVIECVQSAYIMIGNIAFAAFFLLLTENVALAVFIFLALEVVLPNVILYARTLFDFIGRYNLDRLDYSALGRMAYSDFILGLTGPAVLKLLVGFVLYVGVFLIMTAVFFNRKEIDF